MPKSKHEIPGRVRTTYEFIKAQVVSVKWWKSLSASSSGT